MSKLGNIYILHINRKQKDKYPVVYMNKEYIYCKQHGSYELRCFSVPKKFSDTYSYEHFKKVYEIGRVDNDRTYTIYVPADIKTFFEWIKEKSPLEKEIERVQYAIDQYHLQARGYENSIARSTTEIKRLNSLIYTEAEKLSKLQKQLSEMKETTDEV